jgi:hypothetical protein
MEDKINITLEYYYLKRKEIMDFSNKNSNLTADQLIKNGEELAVLEYKITALQVALEN